MMAGIVMRICLLLLALLEFAPAVRAQFTNLAVGYVTHDFAAAKAAGFDYAEIRVREIMKLSDDEFTKFAADSRRAGLPLLTGNVFLPPELKVVGTNVDMAAVTNYFAKALDRCETLGVKKIVWGSGESRRAPEKFSKAAAFAQLVSLAKILAPLAKPHDIVVVVEPVRQAESNLINTDAEGLRWVEAVDHPNFQLLVDIFHLTAEHEDPAILVKAGAHLQHVHMANPLGRTFPPGTNGFDYAPFFRALKTIGYHGTITIEAKAENFTNDAPVAIKFLRAACAPAGKN